MADRKCHAKNFRWYSLVIWKPLTQGTKMGGGKEKHFRQQCDSYIGQLKDLLVERFEWEKVVIV